MKNSENCDSPQQLCPSQEHAKVSTLSSLKTELEALDNFEEKLKKVIKLMKASMAQSGNPDFITFWKARKIVLEIFQENIPPPIKAAMWEEYCALVKEARRLKEIFEQQSAFTIEQIDIAILALEEDIAKYPRQLEKVPTTNFPSSCEALKGNFSYYQELHFQLRFLDAHASHINALRKELLKTDMRIRKKSQFFQRLSVAGDHVFPRRKELIKKVSQQFIDDIEVFFNVNFSENKEEKKLYVLREEIKELQSIAKRLTLNTSSFTQTRKILSKCWETLKEWEKKRKKEQIKKKIIDKKNAELVKDKIKSDQKRRKLKLEREQKRQEQIKNVENTIHSFMDAQDISNHTSLAENIRTIKQQIHQLVLSDSERENFQRLLMPVEDAIDAQEENELCHLPSDNKQKAMKQLKEALQRRQQKREEIKGKIEKYRKASGSSGLNFKKSLYFSDQLNVGKERLKKINESIRQLEAMIAHFIPSQSTQPND